ncbi:MAG TPA: ABC transporter permease subunit [archaeon]|nr:ABC transporter permease subunit [archaeon]
MKIWAILEDTFRECLGKKTLIIFFLISTLAIIFLFFASGVNISTEQSGNISLFGNKNDGLDLSTLSGGILKAEAFFSIAIYAIGIFLSVFATADLLPGILQKGRIDLYLARPISRPRFLLGKFLGAVAVVAVNIVYAIGGIWLVFGMKTGVWNVRFLFSCLSIVFMFAVLYTVMLLIGLLIRNTAVTMLVPYLIIIIINPVLTQKENILAFIDNRIIRFLFELMYQITPKFSEVGTITRNIVEGTPVESWTPALNSLLIGLVVMGITVHIFSRKDF